jgi:precorrin-3B synthase
VRYPNSPPYGERVGRARDNDACPGALQLHQAADGAVARVRLPGGMMTVEQLAALANVATRSGSGTLELTSRGNVQLRGIADAATVADAIAGAGLLPSATHERVRNIVASPLSGRVGGLTDVRPWVSDLDAAIRAQSVLAELSGRFWFSIDDGRADVSGLGADVGAHVTADGVALLLAGSDTGVRLDAVDVIPTMIDVATRFVHTRGPAWRVAEMADRGQLLDVAPTAQPGATFPAVTRPPVGWIEQLDGRIALGAAVPLGVLPARHAEFVAAIGAPVLITPWRSLLVCDLDEGVADTALRVLAPMGLVLDEGSGWLDVSACVGSPGCARSAADVRAHVMAVVDSGDTGPGHRHFVGCERACGRPPAGDVLLATPDGYRPLRPRP